MQRIGVVAALAALAVGSVVGQAAAENDRPQRIAHCGATKVNVAQERRLLRLVNRHRRAHGLRTLRRSRTLLRHARVHNRWMASRRVFAHRRAGMRFGGGAPIAQNIAHASSAAEAVGALMASPGHRRNMLPRRWRSAGFAALSCRDDILFTLNVSAAVHR